MEKQTIKGKPSIVVEWLHARRDAKLYLACELGPGSRLSEAIRAASDRAIDVHDIDRQLDFIRADLAEESLLVAMSDDGVANGRRYVSLLPTSIARFLAARPSGLTDFEFLDHSRFLLARQLVSA